MSCEHENTHIEAWESSQIEVCDDCDAVRDHDERNADPAFVAETAWCVVDLEAKRESRRLREKTKR